MYVKGANFKVARSPVATQNSVRQVKTVSCLAHLAIENFAHIVLCIKMQKTKVCKGLKSYFLIYCFELVPY